MLEMSNEQKRTAERWSLEELLLKDRAKLETIINVLVAAMWEIRSRAEGNHADPESYLADIASIARCAIAQAEVVE
jgi:hypothetical protein